MYQVLRLTIGTVAIVYASLLTSVPAQVAITQMMLTEKHIEDFIAAQKAMSAVLERMHGPAFSDQAFAKYQADREEVIRKHGFKDYAEYEAVAAYLDRSGEH